MVGLLAFGSLAVLVILVIITNISPLKFNFHPPHLEHISSSGVKTDPGLLGLNATPAWN